MKREAAVWQALPFNSFWQLPWGEVWEQRDCPCGSTLVLIICEGEPEMAEVTS